MTEDQRIIALAALRKDSVIARLIEELPVPSAARCDETRRDVFSDLVNSIVSQQLSVRAAATIMGRVVEALPDGAVSARSLLQVPDDTLRAAGLSRPKIRYIKGIAERVGDGSFDLQTLYSLPDADAIAKLVELPGVGVWTAEMVLIFSLCRLDVFSVGDLGLRAAVARLYGVDREDRPRIEEIAERWKPHRTLASLYLWDSHDNKPLG